MRISLPLITVQLITSHTTLVKTNMQELKFNLSLFQMFSANTLGGVGVRARLEIQGSRVQTRLR